MEKKNEIYYRVVPFIWIYGIVVLLALYFIFGADYAFSFGLGLATSLLNFSLMIKAVRTSLSKPEGTRMRYLMIQQGLRYLIYIGILMYAAFTPDLEVIVAFIGMLSVKIVMFVYVLVSKKEDAE